MLAGQADLFLLPIFTILAIQQSHIAGALHESCVAFRTEFSDDVVASLPVTHLDPDFDEFVMIEADVQLGKDRVR